MLVFHGFGQDYEAFNWFSKSLAEKYTLYIFDLYFHGKSVWAHNEQPLEKHDWKETVVSFLKCHNIDEFSLAGFSLGGKFALATLEAFPEKVMEIYLIAPDGIKTSFWHHLATYPLAFRSLFKSMILHHNRFLWLARALNKLSLVDKGLIRFSEHQMSTEEKRRRVYYSWVVFRHLKFSVQALAKVINHHHIDVTVIVGKYDKVILPKNMDSFQKRLHRSQLLILETGHNGLIDKAVEFILKN
ncbi:MAG: alpha/beta fold hydrolase [Bacteroidota bacterium]